MYYVYVLKSKIDGSFYKGMTKDLKERLAEHNSGSTRYTSGKKSYQLIWYCAFPIKTQTLKFEKYLKRGSGHAFTEKYLL